MTSKATAVAVSRGTPVTLARAVTQPWQSVWDASRPGSAVTHYTSLVLFNEAD